WRLPHRAENQGAKHAEHRLAGALADPGELADRLSHCVQRSTTEQTRKHVRSEIRHQVLAGTADEILEVLKRIGLLRQRVGELACPIGSGGNVSEACKKSGDRTRDGFLRDIAIKTQNRSDLRYHVRSEELHHYRDQIRRHGDPPEQGAVAYSG